MWININKQIKITCCSTSGSRFTFSSQSYPCSIINTLWNSYRYSFRGLFFTLTITIITRISNFLAISITLRTSLLDSKETLIRSYSSIPTTIWATVWRITWFWSITFASSTLFWCRKFNILFFAMISLSWQKTRY